MIENNIGYRVKHTSGPSPGSGTTYEIISTQNDWHSGTILSTGGYGYGCCHIGDMSFINSSTGLRDHNDQGVHSFQRTTDNGVTWYSFAYGTIASTIDLLMVNDSVGYVSGTYYTPYRSLLYKLTPSGSTQLFEWDSLLFNWSDLEFIDQDTGYIIMHDTAQVNYLLKTIDSGINWNTVFTGSVNELTSVCFPSGSIGYLSSTNGKVYKTNDGGVNWSDISPSTQEDINSIDFINDTVGYVVCNAGELYRTIDGGSTWDEEASGSSANLFRLKMVDINTAYCSDANGTLLKNNNVLSVGPNWNDQSLLVIYPNPFIGPVTIYYEVETEGNVELTIHDGQGRLVRTLINGMKPSGIHSIEWDGTGMTRTSVPQGAYYLTLTTSSGVGVKKLIKTN